jgi:glycosyltransferase involved in cell wall biosynthesis
VTEEDYDQACELGPRDETALEVLAEEVGPHEDHAPVEGAPPRSAEPALLVPDDCAGHVPEPAEPRQAIGEVLVLPPVLGRDPLVVGNQPHRPFAPAHEASLHPLDVSLRARIEDPAGVAETRHRTLRATGEEKAAQPRGGAAETAFLLLDDPAGSAHDPGIPIDTLERSEKPRINHDVVVEENDHVAGGEIDTPIALHADARRRDGVGDVEGSARSEVADRLLGAAGSVPVDHQDLVRRRVAGGDALQGAAQHAGPSPGHKEHREAHEEGRYSRVASQSHPRADGPIPIAFVSSGTAIGGAEVYLESLLSRLGPEWIGALILHGDGDFADRLRELGHTVHMISTRSRSRAGVVSDAWRLRRLLRRLGAPVVHAHGAKAAVLATLATARTATPVLWLRVDCTFDGRAARAIARRCDQVVGVSQAAVATFGPAADGVSVVYPGLPDLDVDRGAGRAMVREALGRSEPLDAVVLSGRLCPPKGQLELLEIAPRILARRPHAHFAFLGEENRPYSGFEAGLRQRARELGIEDRVAFLGRRSQLIRSVADAVRFVSGCDLLVAPSTRERRRGWREGFGLAAVEALRVGTPVVGYRNGALPEVLGDCAVLVEEGDRDALAGAALRVLGDPALRERLVAGGERRASQRYGLTGAVEAMKTRYAASAQVAE